MSKNYLHLLENLAIKYNVDQNDEEFIELAKFLEAQSSVSDKPLLTDTGLEILEYMQSADISNAKAKDLADGMGSASRKISGALRKLVADGFVDKMGQNPVIYNLTDFGKSFDIATYKETLNNN